jgi:hypothetical protein
MSLSYIYIKWNKRSGEVGGDLPDWLMPREKPHTSGGLMLEARGWIRSFFAIKRCFDFQLLVSSFQCRSFLALYDF